MWIYALLVLLVVLLIAAWRKEMPVPGLLEVVAFSGGLVVGWFGLPVPLEQAREFALMVEQHLGLGARVPAWLAELLNPATLPGLLVAGMALIVILLFIAKFARYGALFVAGLVVGGALTFLPIPPILPPADQMALNQTVANATLALVASLLP